MVAVLFITCNMHFGLAILEDPQGFIKPPKQVNFHESNTIQGNWASILRVPAPNATEGIPHHA